MKSKLKAAIVFVPLVFFACAALFGMRHKCATIDEFAHLPAGYYYWLTGDFSLYSKNPPLVKMLISAPLLFSRPVAREDLTGLRKDAWQPWDYGTRFMRSNWSSYKKLITAGRIPVVFMSIILGLLVYFWSRDLYGEWAGLISLFCFCMSPNITAHGMLATVDAGFSLFIFAATWVLFRFIKKPCMKWSLLAGFLLGLAEISKFTALMWLPLAAAFVLIAAFWPGGFGGGEEAFPHSRRRYLGHFILILFIAWLVTCAGYGFKGMFKPVSGYRFGSSSMRVMQDKFKVFPAPFPEKYLKGLDLQILDSEKGEFSNYLLGEWYRGKRKHYFLVACLFKVPLALQIGFLIALFAERRTRSYGGHGQWNILPEEAGLLVIMLGVSAAFSLGSRLQIGIRYLLPLFPMAFVLIGRLGALNVFKKLWFKVVLCVLGAWLLAANIIIYPDYLSYFNELCLGPKNGHKILLDSNLDWGQDLPGLADYMKKNHIKKIHLAYFGHVDPALYGIEYDLPASRPVHEYTAISANLVFGFKGFKYPLTYHKSQGIIASELLEPYVSQDPVERIGYSIYVFHNPGFFGGRGSKN